MTKGAGLKEIFVDMGTEEMENMTQEDYEDNIEDNEEFETEDVSTDLKTDTQISNKKDNIEINNNDLRMINAYFKEVSTESLLTPAEEINVAAKIRQCEARSQKLRQKLEDALGKKLDRDHSKAIAKLNSYIKNGVLRARIKDNKSSLNRGEIVKTFNLLKAYVNKGVMLRNRFIKANLRLVASMAKRYLGRGVHFLDLIQEGNLGLIKAVERFDYTKGYRFSTYACWWINQAMTRGVFNQTRTVKIPAYLLEKAGKVRSERKKFKEEHGREPHANEIAKRLEMSVENVKRILESAGNNVVTLDTPVWNGEKATYMDYIEDSNSMVVDSVIAEVSIPDNINHALLHLNVREREVVKMRFGIGYEVTYTLDEIGRKFSLTRERIRQIEKKALERIRKSDSGPVLRSLMEVYS